MKPSDVTYLSEPAEDYQRALDAASDHEDLRSALEEWTWIASDAMDAAPTDAQDFQEFKAGLAQERRGRFAGEAWAECFGAILMPELMLRVSEVADQFGVPWGCAFLRLREEGLLADHPDGGLVWRADPEAA